MIANGEGALMAIDYLITQYGGKTANYLDLYGDTAIDDVSEGLSLLEYDPRVKVVCVNTFCGAFEVLQLVKALLVQRRKGVQKKPVVMRIKGYHEKEAIQLLEEYQKAEMAENGTQTIILC